MEKDIKLLLEKLIYNSRQKIIWKRIITVLSFVVMFFTVYFFINSAVALEGVKSYKFNIKDNYDYLWKEGFVTEYSLKLYFMDTSGNYIEGRDITFEIGPNNYVDDPYGFGDIPISGDVTRGVDLIDALNLVELVTSDGEKYEFDHAEVYVNDGWQTFSEDSNHWDIWCQSSSSESLPDDYGWRGKYGNEVKYDITSETEYKFVYKLVRYGVGDSIESLGMDSGISFKMFNYFGDNSENGVNANGLYDYFTFRGIGNVEDRHINSLVDGDGFTENRAKILSKLDNNGYPVFDCGGQCDNDNSIINTSLGYLFGESTNASGDATVGVTSYMPVNTLLQKEIVDGVEYYYYDSNKNAVDYDTQNNRFMLRNYVERGYTITTYANEADRYEFRPFNYWINDKTKLTNISNGLEYNYEVEEIDHWYGMTMEFAFYMPMNGMIDDKDMVFSFSGDDDVWVFIDDVLVLDLGGTHGAVDGSINFKTGYVESYLNWNGVMGTKNVTNIYDMFKNADSVGDVEWNGANTTFANYTKHTLKFFYLERGAAVANCKIRFNIPVLPSGSLSVQKQFVGSDKYNDDYEFRLYDVTSNVPVANTEYTIGQNKFVTDASGKFTLKNTEVAVFKLINEHIYYVEETNTGSYSVSYQCTLDGNICPSANKTSEFVINPESTYQAIFANRVKTFDLMILKMVYEGSLDEEFEFQISLKDENTYPVDILDDIRISNNYIVDYDNGIVTFKLKNNESVTIKDIPINTIVTLQEVKHDGYQTVIKSGDVTLANGDIYEFVLDSNKDITIVNTPGIVLPETGGTGICGYLIVGIMLILIFLRYGYSYFLCEKEGEN